MLKGCHVFLARITEKKTEDKLEETRLEDVTIVCDYPEVFLEDLPGVLPTRQVDFQIDLLRATPDLLDRRSTTSDPSSETKLQERFLASFQDDRSLIIMGVSLLLGMYRDGVDQIIYGLSIVGLQLDFVMSDAEHSTVTYTSMSSDDGSSDVGSLGVIVLGYDGLPMMPEDPYAYPEAAMQEPPPPDFVLQPVYPEFMPPKDDVLPAEEQPLLAAVSPTTDSPGYLTEFDPEEDPEEEDDEDPEEDPADYTADRDDDDDEDESFRDDVDDEEKDEGKDEEEKEEQLAPADSVPPPAYHTTARISIQAQTPIPFLSEIEVDRLLSIRTPSQSPLTSYSSPLPHIPSPPLPTSPTDVVALLGYRAAIIWLRAELPSTSHPLLLPPPIILPRTRASMFMMRAAAPSTYILAPQSEIPPSGTPPLLPIPLPTSSPTLLLPSTDCKTDVLEDTDEIYRRLDDAHDNRFLMSAQLNLLRKDRCSHARTTKLMESEARASCEAWVQSMHASDTTRSETQMVTPQSQQRHARDPAHPNVSEEAGIIFSYDLKKMAPTKRTTRASPATTTTNTPELALMYGRMFLKKSDKIEKYVGGLPDKIHGSVMASKPKTMQDAIEFATELVDKKIHTFAERQTKNKRKFKDTSRNNKNQQ
nr:putative reverse transcriptase domain-containing protein [Tanacetum cinerariifolium]